MVRAAGRTTDDRRRTRCQNTFRTVRWMEIELSRVPIAAR